MTNVMSNLSMLGNIKSSGALTSSSSVVQSLISNYYSMPVSLATATSFSGTSTDSTAKATSSVDTTV